MSASKRGRKKTAAMLLCAVLALLIVPASALSVSFSPLTPGLAPAVPNVNVQPVSPGHLVSTVYRYANTGTVIGCLKDGTKLSVLGSKGNYYRIDCYDMQGYIPKSQVCTGEDGEYYVNCETESAYSKYLPSRSLQEVITMRGDIRNAALAQRGVPYVYGGSTPRGFDCSGFTQYVMAQVGLSLHRSALQQLQDGVIIAKSELQCGDLVFFQNTTGSGRFASHIGIYIGNGELIHAGSKGITVVDLESMYFTYHYLCARRVVLSDLAPTTVIPFTGSLQHNTTSYWRENAQTAE